MLGNTSQINTSHRRGKGVPDEPAAEMTRAGITGEDCPQHSHGAEPALKFHLNKNTFLSELMTIDPEYEMEME